MPAPVDQDGIARQTRQPIAAAEVNRAGVIADGIVKRVLGRHRIGKSTAGSDRAGDAQDKVRGASNAQRRSARTGRVISRVAGVGGGFSVWEPAVFRVAVNEPTPLVRVLFAGTHGLTIAAAELDGSRVTADRVVEGVLRAVTVNVKRGSPPWPNWEP